MATTPDPSTVTTGVAGSLVITSLSIVVFFVLRSGYKRLKNMDRRRTEEK